MRRRTRHALSRITYTPLLGGINAADSPDSLESGEMIDCINFLYREGSQTLSPRGGLVPIASMPAPIRALWHDSDTNILFVFLTDRSTYRLTEGNEPTYIGTLSGTRLPSCAKFQNKLYIASGERLQVYDYAENLTELESAPSADLLFVRGGRLLAARTGSDRLRFSAIGDASAWETDTNDPASGAWLDIGYGDSGDIIAIVPLAADLIILKSNGCIYQLSGDTTPASWRVTQLASDTDPVGQRTAAHLKGSVVYLSARGLVSLAATADYGNITARDIADKIRPLLERPAADARFFPLKRRGLLLIQPHEDKTALVAFHAASGTATRLIFAEPVADLCETGTALLLAAGSTLCRLTDDALTDNGTPITYRIALRHIKGSGKLCLTHLDTHLTAAVSGIAHITAEHSTHPLRTTVPTDRRTQLRTNHTTDTLALTITATEPFTAHTITASAADL